ncbi:MAG: ABC transporter ATP-binding protein/permease [Christensenellaceae bacterium]|jgi:putative ABC transport system permease protein|nr:ABC transporter ATP-binding protein/permease [Christensenellaceae bacterium]
MLKLNSIVKDYEAGGTVVHALRGVSISFRKSEFVSILGPSGCGKTTLMNLIGGLDRATSGEILVNGRTTQSYKDADWDNYRNKRVGFIFQSYYLIPHLTVLNNVELSMALAGVSKEERTARATAALEKVGLTEQLHKKPNEMSGGQMQRAAIARALVNNPEIILADEPTGALDTVTSGQILDLIKELSKERLVIMVTHNPELAEKYSTRTITMRDGEISGDSAPFDGAEVTEYAEVTAAENTALDGEIPEDNAVVAKKERSQMSFLTALTLSFKNLMTKKGRTIITAVAGSIGIIGIALILAVSQGMQSYINKTMADTMANNPIEITSTAVDMTTIIDEMLPSIMGGSSSLRSLAAGNGDREFPAYPEIKEIITKEEPPNQYVSQNIISSGYLGGVSFAEYMQKALADNPEWANDAVFSTGVKLNYYVNTPSLGWQTGGGWNQLLSEEFLKTQYDVVGGTGIPTAVNELAIIVDEANFISENHLIRLGLKEKGDGVTAYSFEDILNTEFKLVLNDGLYEKKLVENGGNNTEYFTKKDRLSIDFDDSDNVITLKITAILRPNKNTGNNGVLSRGIGYTAALADEVIRINSQSEIIKWAEAHYDPLNPGAALCPTDGLPYKLKSAPYASYLGLEPDDPALFRLAREGDMRSLGGFAPDDDPTNYFTPNSILIYPKTFDGKENIKATIRTYNNQHPTEYKIMFTDYSEIIGKVIDGLVNTITIALIAFTAISLVVSSVMIGIITYVSVIERTKEIGILRSIGARKRDISSVFNAETVIIGLGAGIIGVSLSLILQIPINSIVKHFANIEANIAALNWYSAIILVFLSMGLTLIAGLLPSRFAARKDPVKALRTE